MENAARPPEFLDVMSVSRRVPDWRVTLPLAHAPTSLIRVGPARVLDRRDAAGTDRPSHAALYCRTELRSGGCDRNVYPQRLGQRGPPGPNSRSLSGPGQGVFFVRRSRSRPPYPAPGCRPVVIAGKRELVSWSGAFLERLLAVAFEHQLRCPPVGVAFSPGLHA